MPEISNCVLDEENAWVARFVELGGNEQDGRSLYRKKADNSPQKKPIHTLVPKIPTTNNIPAQKKKPTRNKANSRSLKLVSSQTDLFELSLDIDNNPASTDNNYLGLIATAMIYASLPHSEIKGSVFKRTHGSVALTILNDPDIGLPYGKLPRIITAFLCTEAKRTNSPTIYLGRSLTDFADKLGLNENGGKRGDLTRLKDQAYRLFTSRITLTGSPNLKSAELHWKNVNITDEGMLLWDPNKTGLSQSWESSLLLSNKFFEECMSHSVPIDFRVLHALRSPLAIDIYIWLTYRYNAITKPTPVSWKQLKLQFGSNYAEDEKGFENFITNFKKQLKVVSGIYKDAKFDVDSKKLTLKPSAPHVKYLIK